MTAARPTRVAPLAKRLLHDLFDAGLTLGQSVPHRRRCLPVGIERRDHFHLVGRIAVARRQRGVIRAFSRSFRKAAQRHWRRLVHAIQESRENRAQPIRRNGVSAGAQRQALSRRTARHATAPLGWLRARYGQGTPDGLQLMGDLSKEDETALRRALEFLLRVRNELHFHAQKEHDVLDRAEQTAHRRRVWLRRVRREFCRSKNSCANIFATPTPCSRWLADFWKGRKPWMKLGEMLSPLFSHQVEGDFRVGPTRITATRAGLKKVQSDLAQILRLADLANLYNKRIAHSTWEAIHRVAPNLPDVITSESAERFLSVLSQPARLGELLRSLHELGVLERLIPAFAHARSLLQFNEYHKFTVDEHCLRAVEAATAIQHESDPWGEVYRSIENKRVLHLALLIHDLGKGFLEDHSEIGLRIADETARRLRLPPHETEILKFLVHKHLVMSHLAFRRDTSDDQIIVRFAVEVGSPEVLRMLYVLTCADLAAVGPGVLNSWKAEVLNDLYLRTLRHLSGDSPSLLADERRAAARAMVAGDANLEWFIVQINALPSSYLMNTPPVQIADELRRVRDLGHGEVKVWHRYLPDTGVIEYTVGTYEDITPGVFHKLTGGLTSAGLQILSADINTLPEGLVLDRFRVQDPDFVGQPPPERMDEIDRRLIDSLKTGEPPAFRRLWRTGRNRPAPPCKCCQRKFGSTTARPIGSPSSKCSPPTAWVCCTQFRESCSNWGYRSRWPRSAHIWTKWSTCST